ncbi:heterokaryon incompatibility protein-domain-containing protein [Colletotrichum lupini]|nr:heterokaryon incompatibility protein-domain-containing protein [Colletotrichum lupini]
MSGEDPPAYSPPSYASTIYTPLAQSDVVRVLILYPAITHDAEIQCELLSTEISTCQELEQSYIALSYVWGDQSDPQLVYVNNHEVYIGRNLSEALRHLRRRGYPIRLWADALCINQDDVAERNDQVHQMRNIYSSALETVIYLGEDDGSNTTSSAWNFLERQSEWALNEDGNEDTQLPSTLEEDLIYFRGDVADVELSVLNKAWFLRVWVLQEVVVSKKVSIQCGHRRVPWNDFCKTLLLNPRYHDRYGYSMQAIERVDIVRDMFQARCAYQESHGLVHLRPSWHANVTNYGGRSAHIIDMLVRARQLEASDPRDKIFALLGISTNVDLDNRLIAVDYSKSQAEVQTNLARYIMEEHKSLDILS